MDNQRLIMAQAVQNMKYADLDDFVARILEVAKNDDGELNDLRYVALALLDWCDEITIAAQESK